MAFGCQNGGIDREGLRNGDDLLWIIALMTLCNRWGDTRLATVKVLEIECHGDMNIHFSYVTQAILSMALLKNGRGQINLLHNEFQMADSVVCFKARIVVAHHN